jgi:hypothetical protein
LLRVFRCNLVVSAVVEGVLVDPRAAFLVAVVAV